jgi:hypothetical protein
MIKRRVRNAALVLWALLLGLAFPGAARAQGVTTSAVSGRVTTQEGAGVANARVTLTNTATGASSGVGTRPDGRYLLPGLQPGTYRIQVTALGYGAQTRNNVTLSLGQTANFDFTVAQEALALEGLTVVAENEGAVISRGRTGTSAVLSDSTLRRAPTITRDLQDFTRLVPQLAVTNSTTGAVSGGGRNNRFNQLQIDGTASNDLFGLSASGSPGGQAGAKPITLEAVQELQVVLAPFDVRQNGFTGASVNAVTRSGTNRFQGSLSGFTRNEGFVGRYTTAEDTTSAKIAEFQNREIAGSFGGPIIRDKAFFFLAGESTARRDPTNYVVQDNPTVGVTRAQAEQVRAFLATQGYDPGDLEDRNIERESTNLFGRLDFNLGQNNRLTLRHNYVTGVRDQFPRSAGSFVLGNAGYVQNNTTHSSVLQLNSGFGSGLFNELRLGYNRVRDHRDYPGGNFPRVSVRFGGTNRVVVGGSENSSVANVLDQDAFEFTNDLTIPWRAHTFTVGTSNEFAKFSNLFAQNIYGNYTFESYENLVAGTPLNYTFRYPQPGQEGLPRAEFSYRRYSLYAQDRWDALDNLQLTFGVRWELPTFPDEPRYNPLVEQFYQRDTREVPKSNGLINPRVGFNWDVLGDQSTQVRGGVGFFSGRAPFVWVSNAYGNTGMEYVSFTCSTAATSPRFSADPNNQPRNCAGSAPTTPAPNDINLVDPELKLPQVARYSLGVDRELFLGLIGTVEGLYTQTINDLHYQNLRVVPVAGSTVEGRQLYRTRTATETPGIGSVIDVINTDEGFTYSLTGQVQRPFRNGWDFSLAYTYARSEDLAPLNNSTAGSNWSFNLTRDDPNMPERTLSDNDIPHRLVGTTSYRLNLFSRSSTDLSLVYIGQSGRPFSFRYGSDVNGDGSTGNDLVYVPADQSEVRFAAGTGATANLTPQASWQNLNALIESVECLREARGTVIKRNACREPWSNRFDFRVAQNLSPIGTQNAQITLDILNVGNLLNREWGASMFASNQAYNLLSTSGTAAPVNGRRLYQPFAPRTLDDVLTISNLDSRYQIQLGLRYSF